MTTTKKESEILKELIVQNREAIKAAEAKIVQLNRKLMAGPGVDKRQIPDQLAALRSKIANYENAIATHERRLPQVEQLEGIAANVEAKQAREEAEREAAAKAERDQAIMAAAREAWLANGQTLQAFEQQWPTMQATLAREAALDAAAVVAAQPSQGDQVRAAALQALTAKYGQPIRSGPVIQVGDPAAPSVRDERLFSPVPKR